MSDILRYDDVIKISEFLSENGYHDIIIVNEVESNKILNRINEDFFYRLRDTGDTESQPVVSDEVSLKIGENTFLYRVRDND